MQVILFTLVLTCLLFKAACFLPCTVHNKFRHIHHQANTQIKASEDKGNSNETWDIDNNSKSNGNKSGMISVILLRDFDSYRPGDIIKVDKQLAKIFLIPKRYAAQATPENLLKYMTLIESATDVLDHGDYDVVKIPEALTLLSRLDTDSFTPTPPRSIPIREITTDEANSIINKLRIVLQAKDEASNLFGIPLQSGGGIGGILGSVYQRFGGEYLYPTALEQAANCFYFVIKNHPYVDGNKRIACRLFVEMLEMNDLLYDSQGNSKLAGIALAYIAVSVAISDPKQKDTMIKFVMESVLLRI